MEVTLLVADSATDNKDGTFSALRVGITEVYGPLGQPVGFRIAVIVRLWLEAAENGKHSMRIDIRNEDGKRAGPSARADIEAKGDTAAGIPFVLQIAGSLPHGKYEVDAVVGNQLRATWPLLVRAPRAGERPPAAPPATPPTEPPTQ